MAHQYEEVGRVRGLSRFPFKSMSGEAIQESRIGWHGIEGDRRFAILKSTDKSGFPWFTCRDYPPLVQYRASYVDPGNLRDSAIQVKTPAGHDLPAGSPELLEELQQHSKTPLQLIQLWSGVFDAMDISVISVESIKSVEVMVGGKLDERRFRSNITIETTPFLTREFPEEKFDKVKNAFPVIIASIRQFGECHSSSLFCRLATLGYASLLAASKRRLASA